MGVLEPPTGQPRWSRRRFLSAAAIVGAAATLPGSRRRLLQRSGYPLDAETPLDLLTSYVTPNDLFFVRHHWNPSFPSPDGWRLRVDGEVERPLELSLAELKAMPRTTVTCVLQCAGNGRGLYRPTVPGVQWKAGAVGNAVWTGVSVRELLARAKSREAARHIHTFGADKPPLKVPPFHRSLELPKALADGLVAYEMNGAPVPALHGGPARLVVPGWAGDHWMKWLERLSAQPEPQKGFYMETAYRYPKNPGAPGAPVPPEETHSLTELFVKADITRSPETARVGSPVTLAGFAFSGAPDIAKVEVSDDGGTSWRSATLGSDHAPWAWRLWTFSYTPRSAGTATLHARATDSRGAVQPREAVWNPSGYLYNAWPSARFEVRG